MSCSTGSVARSGPNGKLPRQMEFGVQITLQSIFQGHCKPPSGSGRGTASEAAEKFDKTAKSSPQALKRIRIFNDLTTRVNSCPSQNRPHRSFSAACSVVPPTVARNAGFRFCFKLGARSV